MPVTRTKEKTQHVVNTHVQHAVNAVEAEKPIINETINQVTKHVEIPQLQIFEKTIEDAKHIQQERVQNHTVDQIVDESVPRMMEEIREVVRHVLQERVHSNTIEVAKFNPEETGQVVQRGRRPADDGGKS